MSSDSNVIRFHSDNEMKKAVFSSLELFLQQEKAAGEHGNEERSNQISDQFFLSIENLGYMVPETGYGVLCKEIVLGVFWRECEQGRISLPPEVRALDESINSDKNRFRPAESQRDFRLISPTRR